MPGRRSHSATMFLRLTLGYPQLRNCRDRCAFSFASPPPRPGRGNHHSVPPSVLCAIERLVGCLDQLFLSLPVQRVARYASRDRNSAQRPPFMLQIQGPNLYSQHVDPLLRRIRRHSHDNHKLLAAVATRDISARARWRSSVPRARNTASPASWPKASLQRLKKSISSIAMLSGSPERLARASSRSSASTR